jgi:hypothetical protein
MEAGSPKRPATTRSSPAHRLGHRLCPQGIAKIAEIAKIGNFEALLRLTASN